VEMEIGLLLFDWWRPLELFGDYFSVDCLIV
jgi:hypothetical protein